MIITWATFKAACAQAFEDMGRTAMMEEGFMFLTEESGTGFEPPEEQQEEEGHTV